LYHQPLSLKSKGREEKHPPFPFLFHFAIFVRTCVFLWVKRVLIGPKKDETLNIERYKKKKEKRKKKKEKEKEKEKRKKDGRPH